MLTSKWHMHRMGLVDFWYYINEEFMFDQGHMLLRGSNGSGKSVTMQSFIPLLLDGNKNSERLDSFGTRSRKIENYLLEEDSDRNDRIGYLYLEFKREDSDIYKTIGIGLRARKNKPVEAWYFVIEDNRRINYDIQLMDHSLAITKVSLKNIIGEQLIDGQKEYMDRVNHALFGFSTRDEYKEAINLLLQLRSPKLSNSLKPTMINEILSNSLQPLSEDDLRPMSEAIVNMDEIKDQLDALKQSNIAAKNIASVFEQYNYASLDKKVINYLKEKRVVETLEKEIKVIASTKHTKQRQKIDCDNKMESILMEESVLKTQYADLLKQDMKQLVEDVAQHKKEIQEDTIRLQSKMDQEDKKDQQYLDEKKALKNYGEKKSINQFELEKIFKEMSVLQEEMQFEEHLLIQHEMMDHIEQEYDFAYTQKRIKDELNSLYKGIEVFRTINNEKQVIQHYLEDKERYLLKLEQQEIECNSIQGQFVGLVEEYKEKFSCWNKDNLLLCLSDEEMLKIMDYIQKFEIDDTYSLIEEMIQNNFFKVHQDLIIKQTRVQNELNEMNDSIRKVNNEIKEWKEMKDPQPSLDEFMIRCRSYLDEHKIAYKPLYTMLEFDHSVSMKVRNSFEEGLDRLNILNALLVEQTNREFILSLPEGMADQFIFIDKRIDEINSYIIISDDDKIDFNKMMNYFGIEEKQLEIYQSYYQSNIVTGLISRDVETTYIGKETREQYRVQQIRCLELKQQGLNEEKETLNNHLIKLVNDLQKLEIEYKNYPNKIDLEVAKQELLEIQRQISSTQLQINVLNDEINNKEGIIKTLLLQINEIAKHLGINAISETFEKRYQNFQEYEKLLYAFISEHKQFLSYHDQFESTSNRLDILLEDLDFVRLERKNVEHHLEKLNQLVIAKETQLEAQGYEEIKNKIEIIYTRLDQIPNDISKLDREIGTLINEIENLENETLTKQAMLLNQIEIKKEKHDLYLEELKLGYVYKEEINAKDVHDFIVNTFPNLKEKDVLANEFQTIYYTNRGALQDYNLSIINLFENYKEGNARLDINARYKGSRISFVLLLEHLETAIEKQSLLLADSDRILIEDILVNTISKKIRLHIQNSHQWVKSMNAYMDSMNTSSGLKLSLQWKSHKALNEEEMSSENLIKLLEKDVRILKESDLKRLSSHFRSKITNARKLVNQQDNNDSFHQIMKKIMDYRAWFDFRILYEKIGEKKKELTNNAFYAFSGGEKAMSMYIPLFSAVAAKFEGANDDAPLLIALDEAFAGVDEKNINNMFTLIEKFKFDYIMNSQVLWGDYPSVKSLLIHELFRPENARFVSVISYRWNGHKKSMVN